MKLACGILLTSLLTITFIHTTSANAEKITPKIVGGVEANPEEFPFIVSLQSSSYGGHFCGGSLIAPNKVLTAAHCMGARNFKVAIGVHDQKKLENVEIHTVKSITVHPEYKSRGIDYDFAIVELSESSQFPPVTINTEEIEIPAGDDEFSILSTTAGWGAIREGGGLSSKLQKVEVPLVDSTRCDKAYPGEVTDRMICAGYDEGGKDSCQGDSGGPLVVYTEAGDAILTGVVSWGYGCARPNRFGVYAKVNSVAPWIQSLLEPGPESSKK